MILREIKEPDHEYGVLRDFYTQIVAFPVVTSTFKRLTDVEKRTLNASLKGIESHLQEILPLVQNRNEDFENANTD